PGASHAYLAELAATGVLVMSFDHQAAITFPSQLVVNPVLAPGREAYEFSPGTQLLLGARYTLVRSEIRRIRPIRAQEPPPPFSALVALGEDNAPEKMTELAGHLLNPPRLERVEMGVGAEYVGLAVLQEAAAALPERLKVVTETNEIVARLTRCHFAVTAGGGYALELACIGMPQLLIVQSEANWPNAQR